MNHRESRHKSAPRRDPAKGGERPAKLPSNQLWLYGAHAVLAALANKERKIRRIVLTAEALRSHAASIQRARALRPLPGEETTERQELDRLLPPGAVHQGIAVLAEHLDSPGIEDIGRLAQNRDHAVVMVLDQVTDPHNVGAILRSAAAFGALAVVVTDRHSPEETGTLAKSASGALEVMPLVRVTNMVRALEQLKEAGFWTAGLAGEATQTLAQAKLSGKIALVMGAEGEGLRRLTREHCDHLVKLPMSDLVESLNVSNAAAISLYELARDQDLAVPPASH
ncbi:23S rRNA (guanosine-2'-O-)-methyltransferase RlmB [Magnetospirillum gryphiswaldense MSR-1 v2]|uniref:23S rRNA (Guanosine-2'-O-)-methyltransferase RlmB n=1 Tax=Magnetospirillum gryphiswaldense (strain DSM 6361 / JCM 21280 / NBRC 15271 / MSR-1) TaxID=431944 RepID=V6EYV5_MAGGM|nr:23S rRNA (guanosine(2251)-2'-O)-methyltransferase RlmB [Magnetospirillum gryphiswaldense]CDK97236.1 23S rRNA (guanosine-2'-O-)-methyltransferase RlmB [Magnetospirillum gryphiswaldense MSR-1 v2]